MDVEKLRKWFYANKRDFPWRENPSPYQVLISEVMLQQTRASVVIPYYRKWMARFPSLKELSEAKEEEVIKCWEGLGYYSRARALHEAAKVICKEHRGMVPSDREKLSQIKGIGPYTAGAILSFAFKQRAVAVDGNVVRVLSRYYLIEEEVSKARVRLVIENKAEALLPEAKPWEISEALIELGALVCKKSPDCEGCVLRGACLGYKSGKQLMLPRKKERVETTLLRRSVFALVCGSQILLRKNQEGVMKGLFEFPYFDQCKDSTLHIEKKLLEEKWGLIAEFVSVLPKVTHSFTRYRAELRSKVWKVEKKKFPSDHLWIEILQIKTLPFSSGHRRLIRPLLEVIDEQGTISLPSR